MRQHLYRGIRIDNGEWVEGYYGIFKNIPQIYVPFTEEEEERNKSHFLSAIGGLWNTVNIESVGQYTGMNEFVLTDESYNAKLFEGDIVEVWGWRTVRGRNQSQYDQKIKVRGVIRFQHGEWCIDYDNNYNRSLAVLKGSEVQERDVSGATRLYYYGCRRNDREEYRARQLEWHRKFRNDDGIVGHDDIKRIGTEFENSELLEG